MAVNHMLAGKNTHTHTHNLFKPVIWKTHLYKRSAYICHWKQRSRDGFDITESTESHQVISVPSTHQLLIGACKHT